MNGRCLVVVSFDPGETVGWAIHRVSGKLLLDQGQVGSVSRMKWTTGQFNEGSTSRNVSRFLAIARTAYERVGEEDDLFVLVGESFQLRMLSMESSLLEPVRFNAVIGDRLQDLWNVEWQTPSDAKSVITDQRLKLWGLWQAGQEHGRDAQRHGLLYLRRFYSDGRVRERLGW